MEEGGSRWVSSRVTCPGKSVCLVLPPCSPEARAETQRALCSSVCVVLLCEALLTFERGDT